MEKIINVNYLGSSLPIEEGAHAQLIQYEQDLRAYLSKEAEAEEVFKDLQARIHEILQGKLAQQTFISQKDIEEVMSIIGRPNELYNADANEPITATIDKQQIIAPAQKRLRRNANDKWLSGLCGGIANYTAIDPVAIRLLVVIITIINPALGIVAYALGWLIPIEALPLNTARKFFRNPYDRIFGGVCGGLATFFQKEAWLFRLMFLAPVIASMLGFRHIGGWLGGSLFGSFAATYIILWIITPRLKTASDYALLKGQAINLSNYNSASALPLATNASGGLNTAARVLGYILLALLLMIFLPIAFGVLIGGLVVHKLAALVLATGFMKALFWLSLICFFALPMIALAVWVVRRLMGAKHNPRMRWAFGSLFALGLVATLLLVGNLVKDMNTLNKVQTVMPLMPTGDTLVVKAMGDTTDGAEVLFTFNQYDDIVVEKETGLDIQAIRFRKEPTTDSVFSLTIKKMSLGSSKPNAAELATAINFIPYFDNEKTLYIPKTLLLSRGQPYRGQNVEVILHVPENKTVVMHSSMKTGKEWFSEGWNSNSRKKTRIIYSNGSLNDTLVIDGNDTDLTIEDSQEELKEAMETLQAVQREIDDAARQATEELDATKREGQERLSSARRDLEEKQRQLEELKKKNR